jgi:hypothetical protein
MKVTFAYPDIYPDFLQLLNYLLNFHRKAKLEGRRVKTA